MPSTLTSPAPASLALAGRSDHDVHADVAACCDQLELAVDPTDRIAVAVAVLDTVCNLNPLSSDAVDVGWNLAVAIGQLVRTPGTVDIHAEAARATRRAVESPSNTYSAVVGLGITDPGTGRRRQAMTDRVGPGVLRLALAWEDRGLLIRTPKERDLGI